MPMWPRWSPKPPNWASTRYVSRRRWCRPRSAAAGGGCGSRRWRAFRRASTCPRSRRKRPRGRGVRCRARSTWSSTSALRSPATSTRCGPISKRCVRAVAGAVLKVIVESAVLLGQADERTLAAVCRAAEDAGADFVKTSTGFHPAGGASVRAVALMAETVGGRLGVKASGGIRTAADAVAMLDAGATRLGLSGTRAVLDGLSQTRRGVRGWRSRGRSLPAGDGGVLGGEVAHHTGIGHLHAVRVNTHREVLGQVAR